MPEFETNDEPKDDASKLTEKSRWKLPEIVVLLSLGLILLGGWKHYKIANTMRLIEITKNDIELKRKRELEERSRPASPRHSNTRSFYSDSGSTTKEEWLIIWRRVWMAGCAIAVSTTFYVLYSASKRSA